MWVNLLEIPMYKIVQWWWWWWGPFSAIISLFFFMSSYGVYRYYHSRFILYIPISRSIISCFIARRNSQTSDLHLKLLLLKIMLCLFMLITIFTFYFFSPFSLQVDLHIPFVHVSLFILFFRSSFHILNNFVFVWLFTSLRLK